MGREREREERWDGEDRFLLDEREVIRRDDACRPVRFPDKSEEIGSAGGQVRIEGRRATGDEGPRGGKRDRPGGPPLAAVVRDVEELALGERELLRVVQARRVSVQRLSTPHDRPSARQNDHECETKRRTFARRVYSSSGPPPPAPADLSKSRSLLPLRTSRIPSSPAPDTELVSLTWLAFPPGG